MKTRTFKLAGGAIAIAALAAFAPKAAHAVTAALVQVTNTIPNPAITHAVRDSASQIILLHPPFNADVTSGQQVNMRQVTASSGLSANDYVVPSGQSLVITDLNFEENDTLSSQMILRTDASTLLPLQYFYFTGRGTHDYHFQTGIVFPAGSHVILENQGPGDVSVSLSGYLTSN